MFPVKGDVQLVLARHLCFPRAKEAKCKRQCVYRINAPRRSPGGFPRQTVDDRRKKLSPNHRALCSEIPLHTEAFSG